MCPYVGNKRLHHRVAGTPLILSNTGCIFTAFVIHIRRLVSYLLVFSIGGVLRGVIGLSGAQKGGPVPGR